MLTIRGRAMEIAGDPANFERPIEYHASPGDAKLEADAYLAICADQIVGRLVASHEKRVNFAATFQSLMRQGYKGKPNTQINLTQAAEHFVESFGAIYIDKDVFDDVAKRGRSARNTTAACQHYADTCKAYLTRHSTADEPPKLPTSIAAYYEPSNLLQTGASSVQPEIRILLKGLYATHGLSIDERLALLEGAETDFARTGSLSLAQFRVSNIRSKPVITNGKIDTIPNIAELRAKPTHTNGIEAVLRPHRGCPAMPDLVAGQFLEGGSGIRKLAGLAVQLIKAANLHAFDSDQPEHTIMQVPAPSQSAA